MSVGELITVAPAEPHHLDGLRHLFEATSAGCFCRFWHFDGEDNDWLARCASGDNEQDFARAVSRRDDEARGVVASVDGEVVGWLKLAPAPSMNKLRSRRVYRTLACFDGPRDGVAVIACVLVHPRARRRGVGRRLIAGAVEIARSLGATSVEAYPRVAAHALRDDELQMGPVTVYEELGFAVVDGPTPYPVMRLSWVG